MTIKFSDAELNTVRSRVRQRKTMRNLQYRGRVSSALSGLACACNNASTQRLSGYRLATLRGYRVSTVRAKKLSGFGAPSETLALIPISDKRALTNAVKFFSAARRTNGLSGFGDTAQASAAASGAAAGAKAGSIVPGIGTVIGAVVGAVVGWLSAKKKPVRATAEEVAQCRAMLTEYMGFAAQSPNAPLPMEWTQLLDLNWCTNAVYGAEVGNRDPRFFNPGFESGTRAVAIAMVKKIYETPIGATVNLDAITFKSPSGRTTNFGSYSFVNPPFTDLKTFSANYFEAAELQSCKANAGKGAGGCESFVGRAERKRLLYDLLAWAARTTLPNISESDLRAASQVAATVPGSSAKDVVTAVETILNRSVQRDETTAVLTNQPIPSATSPPNSATAQPLPGVSPQSATDVTALISQMLAQGQQNAQVTQAALDALATRGTPITPVVQDAVQNEVVAQAGGISSTALLTGGGLLALLFLLGRPAKRGRK